MAVARTEADVPSRSARGDAGGRTWPVAAITVSSVAVVLGSVAALVALFPHRVERPITARLRAVRVWNALEYRCQLENDVGRVLPFTCGSNASETLIRGEDAPTRPLVIVRSHRDNCIVDEETLEALLCRDTMIEWALLERDRLSISVLDPRGRGQLVVQKDLASGQLRELLLPYSTWMRATGDPALPIMLFDEHGTPHRLGWGELEPALRSRAL